MDKFKKLKMIDLCAGTGAFSIAFQTTNMVNIVYANDIETTSKTIYDNNLDHILTLKNICDINVEEIPEHDILTAGFPCQPFSIAGKQKGFDDPRSNVFYKIIDIMKYHKPMYVILENVKNLISHEEGRTFKTIIDSIKNENYHIKFQVLNTCKITNIPQNRERIYIICIKDKIGIDNFNFTFPKNNKQTIISMLEDSNNINDKYYYRQNSNIHNMVKNTVINRNSVYQFRRIYVRENKNNCCPTLTANMGTGGHNVPLVVDENGARKLTPRECFNFQGFTNDYNINIGLSDAKLYKLAGNAVSLPVVKLIADKIIKIHILLECDNIVVDMIKYINKEKKFMDKIINL
jgi:DNA (cytosine-5)-methyltransferase 1